MAIKSKYIKLFGIELEGGWDQVFTDEVLRHDGSVRQPISSVTGLPCPHYGELPSEPLRATEVEAWIRKYYPQGVNDSCGFHVHFSTKKNLDYGRLMERKFFTQFHKAAGEWGKSMNLPTGHPFWPRWQGENTQYCGKQHIPHKQVYVPNKGGERYTMLNYCFSLHGTIEVRLAPGWETADLAVKWVEFIAEQVDAYLKAYPKETVRTLTLTTKELDVVDSVKKEFDSLRRLRA